MQVTFTRALHSSAELKHLSLITNYHSHTQINSLSTIYTYTYITADFNLARSFLPTVWIKKSANSERDAAFHQIWADIIGPFVMLAAEVEKHKEIQCNGVKLWWETALCNFSFRFNDHRDFSHAFSTSTWIETHAISRCLWQHSASTLCKEKQSA